ncbi:MULTISPECIES: YhcB family protein [Gammaproteobacteria]|uniref:YhcB family protein n=1 Tax=Gammaproteobacteria TaxID=1236 RepID=UPI000DCFDD75|nr:MULTISPECIES: DUF1043 family protein [Gammaproteobacteria]RTE86338.1 DUF1043 family protein [Aliidiomarina sp. B3213]TCZ91688.1 DUF1043 family protein [Lysobacter sp. N42]
MGWLVGIILVLLGAVIGFFAARYWIMQHSDQADLQAQLDDSKQQFEAYKRDVVDHIATARQLSEQVADVQGKLSKFLGDSEQLLQSDKEWQQPLPFFSEDTMKQLRQASILDPDRRDRDGDASLPPRDYSEPGSGLFKAAETEKQESENKA